MLLFYRTSITVPGLIIIATGVPVYLWMRRGDNGDDARRHTAEVADKAAEQNSVPTPD